MKKLLIFLIVLAIVLFVGMNFVISKIEVDVTDDILPVDIYNSATDPYDMAMAVMLDFYNPLSSKDEYTLTEEFLNYIILDSIHENVNDEYDPLNESCTQSACDVIVETGYGNVEYIVATLNDDNQIVLTVNFNRSEFPDVETALFLTFDVEVDLLEFEINLVLDSVFISDVEISMDNLEWIVGQFDANQIESSITVGELDLETFTYTVSLLP